ASQGDQRRRGHLVRPDRAGVRRVPSGALRGRHGRWPHLRARRRASRRGDERLHDRRLGRASARAARQGIEPHHQRGARHQPRDLRHLVEAAGDDRMGVAMALTMFGIKNCETVKKARAWLESKGVDYAFHDYKSAGVDRKLLEAWSAEVGWEA